MCGYRLLSRDMDEGAVRAGKRQKTDMKSPAESVKVTQLLAKWGLTQDVACPVFRRETFVFPGPAPGNLARVGATAYENEGAGSPSLWEILAQRNPVIRNVCTASSQKFSSENWARTLEL